METYLITFTAVDNFTQMHYCENKEVFDEIYPTYEARDDKLSLSYKTFPSTGSFTS